MQEEDTTNTAEEISDDGTESDGDDMEVDGFVDDRDLGYFETVRWLVNERVQY